MNSTAGEYLLPIGMHPGPVLQPGAASEAAPRPQRLHGEKDRCLSPPPPQTKRLWLEKGGVDAGEAEHTCSLGGSDWGFQHLAGRKA